MKKLCASVLLGVWLAIPAWGQDLPPAPAQGVRDDTRALTEAVQSQLGQEVQEASRALQADVWFNAGTFLRSGQTTRSLATELRQHWSGEKDAILLNYDRSSEAYAYSYSPGIWQRYPSVELISIGRESSKIMADKSQPLEERLAAALRHLIAKMTTLEQERVVSSQVLTPSYMRLGQFFLLLLTAAAAVIFTLGALFRRREVQAAWQKFFPSVHVGTRFGAAHGGGVCAVKE